MRSLLILSLFLLSSLIGLTQTWTKDYFYKHFSGQLDTNMQITFDLFSKNGKLSGYYFYFFELPGKENKFHYGKTIPFEGTLGGNRMILHEFGNTDSKLIGDFSEETVVKGNWQRRQYEDPIIFNLAEDYSIGSIALSSFVKEDTHVLDLPDVPRIETPFAKIDIIILYPDHFPNSKFKQTFDFAITHFMLYDSSSVKSADLLVENITFDYFESYRRANNGILNIEKTASLNLTNMDIRVVLTVLI